MFSRARDRQKNIKLSRNQAFCYAIILAQIKLYQKRLNLRKQTKLNKSQLNLEIYTITGKKRGVFLEITDYIHLSI
jgi:hypothetical protein